MPDRHGPSSACTRRLYDVVLTYAYQETEMNDFPEPRSPMNPQSVFLPGATISGRRAKIAFASPAGADYGGAGPTSMLLSCLRIRYWPARFSQPCPEPIPTYRRKKLCTSWIENIKTRWLGCLPYPCQLQPSQNKTLRSIMSFVVHYQRSSRERS